MIRFRLEITGEAPSGDAGATRIADATDAQEDYVDALKALGFTVGGTINAHDTAIDNSAISVTFGEFGDEVTI